MILDMWYTHPVIRPLYAVWHKDIPAKEKDIDICERYGKADWVYKYKDAKQDNYKHLLRDVYLSGDIVKCGSRTVDLGTTVRHYPLYTYTSLRCSFDIETTSVYTRNIVDGVEDWYSAMYIAMFAINNKCILCSSWHEVRELMLQLPKRLGLARSEVLLTWVHNLDYETSYIKHQVNIDGNTFFGKSRQKPIKYLAEGHIYMHDSYSVTNSSLAKLAEMWSCTHRKAVGDLDYSKIRNSAAIDTMTETEIGYCINDVYVLTDFAGRMFEFWQRYGYIPDTATQILSKDIQQQAIEHMRDFLGAETYDKYREKVDDDSEMLRYLHGKIYGYEYTINGLTRKVKGLVDCDHFTPYSSKQIPPPPEGLQDGDKRIYDFYQWLYRGGYAKSNARWTSEDSYLIDGLREPVEGRDYTSSYPFVQIVCNFPMSSFTEYKTTISEMQQLHLTYGNDDFEKWRHIFIVELYDVEAIDDMALESASKCTYHKAIIDNGRIRAAKRLTACLTDCDWHLYNLYYKYDAAKSRVLRAWRAKAAPLPDYYIIPICKAGVGKAKYKHVEGKEVEYLLAKGKFNTAYGLACKQPVYINYGYDNKLLPTGYSCTEGNTYKFFGHKEQIKHIVEGNDEVVEQLPHEVTNEIDFAKAMSSSILSPYWGIWTSAFARYNLLTICKQISDNSYAYTSDVIYCDTDSVYYREPDKHRCIFERWNKWVSKRVADRLHGKYPELLSLGSFDDVAADDSHGQATQYCRFKTLGSKRYIKSWHDKSGKLHTKVTIAGLPKGIFEQYCKRTGRDMYREFKDLQDFEINSQDMRPDDKHKIGRKYHDKLIKINVAGEIMTEYSCCTLYNTSFKISVDEVYTNLLENVHRHDDGGRELMNEVMKNDRNYIIH